MTDALSFYQRRFNGISLVTLVYEQVWRNATETILLELNIKAEDKIKDEVNQENKETFGEEK